MVKTRTKYVCQSCGYESVKWAGRCAGCGQWNTLVEEIEAAPSKHSAPFGGRATATASTKPQPMAAIPSQMEHRDSSGMEEFDRVLGGGVVPGSMILLGGDPGIGKSTLLLQIAHTLATEGKTVLYISGEESVNQIKLRAERLSASTESLYVMSETDLEAAVRAVEELQPSFLIIDSIQTMFRPDLASAPGSVAQVRECTALLLRVSKNLNVATFIVGHVTKEGHLAGPRMLEHMVDAVLYFEGERHHTFRILRAVKNRFGSTNELAVFEMKGQGLEEVQNPSEMFLSERQVSTPGSAVVAAMEGSRPVLLEAQALVASTSFGTPRRMASGADYNRLCLMIAVLERRIGLHLQQSDAYLNIVGGVQVDEPAIDLGLALALASSFRDRPLRSGDVYIGEVGLTGEVRSVPRLEQRIREAARLGFKRCVVPHHGLRSLPDTPDIRVVGVQSVADALTRAFEPEESP